MSHTSATGDDSGESPFLQLSKPPETRKGKLRHWPKVLALIVLAFLAGSTAAYVLKFGRQNDRGPVSPRMDFSPTEVRPKLPFTALPQTRFSPIAQAMSSAPSPTTSSSVDFAPPLNRPKFHNARLPTNVKPLHYSLVLAPFFYSTNVSDFYFTGNVKIDIRVLKPTSTVKIHTRDLKMKAPRVFDNTGVSQPVMSFIEEPYNQWHSINLNHTLRAGQLYTIVFDRFRGKFAYDMQGLYLSFYATDQDVKYLVVSQMEASYARKVFPCFDEPVHKATFDISIVRHRDYVALGNMPSESVTETSPSDWFNPTDFTTTEEANSFVVERFSRTPVMPTYLLAFTVSQLAKISSTDPQGRLYTNWAQPSILNNTNQSLYFAMEFVRYFEDLLNASYPLNATDQVAVPHFKFGGMENWGHIIYRETYFAISESYDRAETRQVVVTMVAHEVGHQWFGNLVTMDWWSRLWLNEAFATYFSYVAVDYLYPDWEMDAQFVSLDQFKGMAADQKELLHPLQSDVTNVDIDGMFNDITYYKGSSVIRMMYNALGREAFIAGLNDYIQNRSYSTAYPSDLYASLSQRSDQDISIGDAMETWIKQSGFPIVTCDRNVSGVLLLSQNIFRKSPANSPRTRAEQEFNRPNNYTWTIPITLMTNENASNWDGSEVSQLTQWMTDRTQSFAIYPNPRWYLLNLRSTGFYRVNYDRSNWYSLIAQLRENHLVFTPQDRARLIEDSWVLASANEIDRKIPHVLTCYMSKEQHLVPWRALFNNVENIFIVYTLKRYCPEILDSIYRYARNISFEASPTHLNRILGGLIFDELCSMNISTCQADAKQEWSQFVDSNFTEPLAPRTRRAALCVGLFEDRLEPDQFAYYDQFMNDLMASSPDKYPAMRSEWKFLSNYYEVHQKTMVSVQGCIQWLQLKAWL